MFAVLRMNAAPARYHHPKHSLFLLLVVLVDFGEFVAILSRYWLHLVAMLTVVEFFLVLLDKMLVRRPELLISGRH